MIQPNSFGDADDPRVAQQASTKELSVNMNTSLSTRLPLAASSSKASTTFENSFQFEDSSFSEESQTPILKLNPDPHVNVTIFLQSSTSVTNLPATTPPLLSAESDHFINFAVLGSYASKHGRFKIMRS
jgi:hypothetical protein